MEAKRIKPARPYLFIVDGDYIQTPIDGEIKLTELGEKLLRQGRVSVKEMFTANWKNNFDEVPTVEFIDHLLARLDTLQNGPENCRENMQAQYHLEEAKRWLLSR